MDLVYKIGNKCEWENYNELRYSIRSAVEYVKDLENIYIIGVKPNWLINVKHIWINDPYLCNKDGNLINKMILASMDKELSTRFLNMSDDNIFLGNVNESYFDIPIYNNHHIEKIEKSDRNKLTRWEERLQKTVHYLRTRSLMSNCYEAHIPYLLNKEDYAKTLFLYDYGFENGLCGNTLYYNTLNITGRSIEKGDLIRLEMQMNDYEQLVGMLTETKFLNYTTKAFNNHIKAFLMNKFTEKSKYEND